MAQASGVVEVISIKPTARGGNSYNFKLNNDVWYGHGFTSPAFSEGDNISFSFTENGKFKNVDDSTVVVSEAKTTAPTRGAGSAPPPSNSYDDRQLAITYQAARKDALQIVEMALTHDVLSLGAKKAEKLGILEDLVHKMTMQFFEDTKILGKATLDLTGSILVDDDE